MNQEIRVSDKTIWLIGVLFILFTAAIFTAGMTYQKINSRFTYHELPLKSGGIALIVPNKWQVVSEWDKHGRPYVRPSDGE